MVPGFGLIFESLLKKRIEAQASLLLLVEFAFPGLQALGSCALCP